MLAPSVFISYSHKDEEWKDRLVTQLGVLQMEGILDVWDDRRIEAGEDWKPEIEKAINNANVAILMISANFLTSKFILGEEVPKLLTRREKEGVRVIPLIVKPCAWTQVKWLSPIQARPKDGKPLSAGNENQIDSDLAALANEIAAIVRRAETSEVSKTSEVWKIPPDKISLAKLPSTDSTLYGREEKLKQLDDAWNNQQINVLSLIAWGGVGKSALVNKWLLQMAADNYRGAGRVFGWSFYSQGAAEGRQVSADQFIAAALTWFGDEDPTKGSPWDKGERLAELIKGQRTLLILDGLEPLQNPPSVETGRIKDPGLTSLLRELARQNPGMIVITSRLSVDDLKDFTPHPPLQGREWEGSAIEIDLENLLPEAGAEYLAHLGVDGMDEERQEASKDFAGHALALTLMGSYLKVVHHGDIRKRKEIPHVMDEQKQGAHARRVMESYEQWLKGKPELDILRLMGLFDRPAAGGALEALRKEPAIEGLTDALQKLSDADWKYAINNLRDLRLIAMPESGGRVAAGSRYTPSELLDQRHTLAPGASAGVETTDDETLDCHPLLREHFGEKLKANNLNAWREAHSRLYEYYKSVAKELPDTLEEMAPLYGAVMHGCKAGKYQEALIEVYWKRINKTKEFFSTNKLGAMSADLAALSGFFDGTSWGKPVDGLSEDVEGFLLNQAGYRLRALGRLVEAVQPMQTALEGEVIQERWKRAAVVANNLSELYLTIGDVTQALAYAEQSVQLADRSKDAFERWSDRPTLADALHQVGRLAEAQVTFREAEEMLAASEPKFPLLYGFASFRYCDLLLSQDSYAEVGRRASQMLKWATQGDSLFEIALNNLSLGRAHLLQSQREPDHSFTESLTYLNRALDSLRQAGQQWMLPNGLLARAEFYRVTGELNKAQKDLDEAFSIATRGGMGLYLADSHLEYARLCLSFPCGDDVRGQSPKQSLHELGIASLPLAMTDEGLKAAAHKHWQIAKDMINKMGYHRRDKEVEEIEKQL